MNAYDYLTAKSFDVATRHLAESDTEGLLVKAAGIDARIIDMRWLAPLPAEALLKAVEGCKRILVVDECRRTGGQAEALMTLFAENTKVPTARVTAEDSFIATGPAYGATLPSVDAIVEAAVNLAGSKP